MPITADCVVTSSAIMLDGRTSSGSLVVRLGPGDALKFGDNTGPYTDAARQGTYSFASGTLIESGSLVVTFPLAPNSLVSNVEIRAPGALSIQGNMSGDILNHGRLDIWGTQTGIVTNHGTTYLGGEAGKTWRTFEYSQQLGFDNFGLLVAQSGPWDYGGPIIKGDFRQSATAVLRVSLAPSGMISNPLHVTGRALLDGELQIVPYGDAWGPSPLPATGTHAILTATEGISGQFSRWTSPGLFIDGTLRYREEAVLLDVTRISVQAALAAQGFGGVTLASAGNVDRALPIAEALAIAPNASQSRFLRSASRLLWLNDAAQAARSLDSLAGSQHVDAIQALAQDDVLTRGIGARTLALRPGDHAGAWSRVHGGDTVAGFDQWLSPRLLAGAIATQARDAHRDAFSQAQHESPQAALYLRWFGGNGWYAGGSAAYAQHALSLDRRIDLGDGGRWNAHAQRRIGITSFDAEAGRAFASNSVTIAPYLWLGANAVRSERALEQGQTGFELALQDNTQASLDAGLGLRLGKRWRIGDTGWLALDADARHRQRLVQSGASLRAAFIGVPDVWFDVPGNDARGGTWLDLGLRGGFGRGWGWSLGHGGSLTGHVTGRHWQFGLARQL